LARPLLTIVAALVLALAVAGPAMAVSPNQPWYGDGPSGRVLFNDGWLYRADPADVGLAQGWAAQPDVDGWTPTTLPNAWNAGDDSPASMAGSVAWYRRDFVAPTTPAGAQWIVRFESVNYRATVFLNGVQIATHEGASIPFEALLSNLQPGVNRLVVRADSRRGPNDLPPGPGGGWWNYGGILREVYLRPVTGLDISALLTRTIADDALLVRVTLANLDGGLRRASVQLNVAGQRVQLGAVVISAHARRSLSKRVRIPRARLWAPRAPALYKVTATATTRGEPPASYVVHTGLRTLAIRGGQMRIDGVPVNLRGAALHEQTQAVGAALTPVDHALQIAMLRALGATIVRSHYPLSEDFLERADRAGIAVWEEIPFYQLSEAAMRDPLVRQKGLNYLAAAIRRDQNHPSVIAWSIGNELPPKPGWGQAAYIREAASLAHRLDPTRPVALAFAGAPSKNYLRAYAPLNVLGMNDYFGWFAGDTGELVNPAALGPYLDRLHAQYPSKALFVTEFGAEGSRPGTADDKGTFDFQANFMRSHLETFAQRPWLSGAIAWILQDFKVRPGWSGGNPRPDPPWVHKGLVDPNGNLKPAYGFTQQMFERTSPLVRPR
jgi:beta-glucuronidase